MPVVNDPVFGPITASNNEDYNHQIVHEIIIVMYLNT